MLEKLVRCSDCGARVTVDGRMNALLAHSEDEEGVLHVLLPVVEPAVAQGLPGWMARRHA